MKFNVQRGGCVFFLFHIEYSSSTGSRRQGTRGEGNPFLLGMGLLDPVLSLIVGMFAFCIGKRRR
jgi:hypothetical protein